MKTEISTILTMNNFDEALQQFLNRAQSIIDVYYSTTFPNLNAPTLSIQKGKRYVKVISDHSAYVFIDATNGDVLKPAGWKAPAKHARGNIFSEKNGTEYINPYGVASLR